MSLHQDSETADYTFIDVWNKSNGEIVSNHRNQFKDEHSSNASNPKQLTLNTIQIKTLQQGDGDQSCGYYGIFFISKLSQIFHHLSINNKQKKKTKTIDSIIKLMQELRCKESFNKFKKQIMNELLQECKKRDSNCYPWIKDHINSGVLERVYLQFLQNNYFLKNRLQMPHNDSDDPDNDEYPKRYNESIAKKYGFRYLYDSINLMEFSESALKTNHLPLITMDHLEFFFNKKFLTQTENYKIFLIGSAIHYVVVALYRNKNGDIDLIYLDPQNNDILYKSKSDLKNKIIAPMRFESWLKYGWKIEDMRKLAMDSFRGIQFAVTDLITNTIYNLYSNQYNPYFIRDRLIKMNISTGFLGGFKSHVLLPMVRTISKETSKDDGTEQEEKKDNNNNNDEEEPKTGLFVGVNKDFEFKDDNKTDEDHIDINKWKQDVELVMNVITEKLKNIELAQNNNDKDIKQHIDDIKTCSSFAKLWISTYYPSAVIDQNIVNVVNKLESDSYIPKIVLKLLYEWSSLMMVFANANNRRIAEIQDDKFWKRLASTLLVVQMVSQTDPALTTKL